MDLVEDIIEKFKLPCRRGLGDLGGDWDQVQLRAMREVAALPEEEKRRLRGKIDQKLAWIPTSWGEGMATLAVRRRDPHLLVPALAAVALGAHQTDRDGLVVLILLLVAATKLGADRDVLLERAMHQTDAVGREWLSARLGAAAPRVPSTHEERGSDETFEYHRIPHYPDL